MASETRSYMAHIARCSGMTFSSGDEGGDPEPFAGLEYSVELDIKNRAIRSFLGDRRDLSVEKVIPSPLARKYRTTTKRKVQSTPKGPQLLINPSNPAMKTSLLEPDVHVGIYRVAAELLAAKNSRSLADHVNFLVCRGTYDEQTLIINVDRMDAEIVRNSSIMARKLIQDIPSLKSVYLFHDPSRSRYYLDWTEPVEGLKIKRLHGPRHIIIRMGEMTWACPPTGFSQVNLSLVPGLCSLVSKMLSPGGQGRLADMYCGYGLFSRYLAGLYPEIIMMDMATDSVEAARETMERAGHAAFRAVARRITPEAIDSAIPPKGRELDVILDPPRGGCDRGVIGKLAERGPRRVVHLFCDAGRVPLDMDQWSRKGYKPVRIAPLDMFPGTPHLEVAVLLKPAD